MDKKGTIHLFKLFLRALFVIVAIQFVFRIGESNQNYSVIPAVDKGKMAIFSSELGNRTLIRDIEATEEFIYIAYQGYGVVAVYDWNGKYMYSMAFYRGRNGGLGMRCEDGLLYVSDYANYELVLSGDTLINTYEPSNALHYKGWFNVEAELPVVILDSKVYDNMGRYIMELPGRIA